MAMPRPRDGDTRVVLVKVRDGQVQLPYKNAVIVNRMGDMSIEEWVKALRHVVGDRFRWAFVTDMRRPGIRPKYLADPDGTR